MDRRSEASRNIVSQTEKIQFINENGETCDFFVEEQTRVNGRDYLLVSDSREEEAQAFILKDVSQSTDPESIYEFVEDDTELETVAGIFEQMLGDEIDFEMT